MHERSETPDSADRVRPPAVIGPVLVTVGFVLSRLYFGWLGVRFETSSLDWYWQVLDPHLLADRLLESVLFLHAQPPLFNLLLGVGLKLAPVHHAALFKLAYAGLGLTVALLLYAMLTRLGLPRPVASVMVLLYATSPGWLMYESWLFYDFPVAAALVGAAAVLLHRADRMTTGWLAAFFMLIATVVLTRSLFHLVWFLASLILVIAMRPERWRTVVAAAALPLVLILSLYLKNAAVFGFFGTSSWLGMSLTKLTTGALEPEERARWVAEGALSPVALVPPFSPVTAYEEAGVEVIDCGIPTLGWRSRSSGAPNFNHAAYLHVSRLARDDAMVVIRREPAIYLRSVIRAGARFFWSPVNYPPFRDNLVATASTYRLYEATVYRPPVAVALGLLVLLYAFRRGWRDRATGSGLFFAWVALTMLWVFGVSSLLELGENFRFRFTVEPLAVVMLGALIADIASRHRS